MSKTEFETIVLWFGSILIFTLLDILNMPYIKMFQTYGIGLVIINIGLNLLMSLLMVKMFTTSETLLSQFGIKSKGEYVSFSSIIFGLFTYGCAPCIITILSSIGITFSVVVLPLAGLPYKLISLVLLVIGARISMKALTKQGCSI